MAGADDGNQALGAYLSEADLSPRGLARDLNRRFGAGTVAETAPYYWRDSGGTPRSPLPSLVAHALTSRLSRVIAVQDIWPSLPSVSSTVVPASVGMDVPWTPSGTMRIADDWLTGGLVDRRIFLSVSGGALVSAVNRYLDTQNLADVDSPRTLSTEDPLVDQIEASVPRLQMMDDEQGGAAGLGYVGAQVRAVLLVLREGGHSDSTNRRLLAALADLAQLAGWKALDAASPGLAQRYFFTGLRAAHDAGYPSMAAHILADLSFQAASAGDSRDGVLLGEAARRASGRSAPSVKASVLSRLSFAYAAAGDVEAGTRGWMDAQEHLTNRRTGEPGWMYYLTPNHLDCQAGYAMILAGRQQLANGERAAARALLRKGAGLLRTGAYARARNAPYQRRALYEGAWLALGYAAQGKLDESCDVARLAIPRLTQVSSPRSTALLTTLATDLRRRKRHHGVATFLPDLEQALAGSRPAPGA
jgi:hypothetical protein